VDPFLRASRDEGVHDVRHEGDIHLLSHPCSHSIYFRYLEGCRRSVKEDGQVV
jgi:hypothetical protein